MRSDIAAEALDFAQTVVETKHSRRFERSVREFERLLRSVRDCAPGELSPGTIEVMRHLAERVINAIETRLAAHETRTSHQLTLASAVYDIREALEELDQWERHFIRR